MREQIVLPVGIPQGTGGIAAEEGQVFCWLCERLELQRYSILSQGVQQADREHMLLCSHLALTYKIWGI